MRFAFNPSVIGRSGSHCDKLGRIHESRMPHFRNVRAKLHLHADVAFVPLGLLCTMSLLVYSIRPFCCFEVPALHFILGVLTRVAADKKVFAYGMF